MKNTLLVLLFLLLSFQLFAQKKKRQFQVLPYDIGYAYQGTHNLFFGLKPSMYLDSKNAHDNLGIVINGNLMFLEKTVYFTPEAKLRLYKVFQKSFAWNASVGYSYTNIYKKMDHRITPEIGVSFAGLYLSYGYNIPLTNYTDAYTTRHRVAFYLGTF